MIAQQAPTAPCSSTRIPCARIETAASGTTPERSASVPYLPFRSNQTLQIAGRGLRRHPPPSPHVQLPPHASFGICQTPLMSHPRRQPCCFRCPGVMQRISLPQISSSPLTQILSSQPPSIHSLLTDNLSKAHPAMASCISSPSLHLQPRKPTTRDD